MYIKVSKKLLTIAKALAYCTTELIMAVKSLMIQAPGAVIATLHFLRNLLMAPLS